jgi:competence protein ComEC
MKKWPLHNAWFWESAPFFRVLLPIVAGIAGYSVNHRFLSFLWLVAIAIVGFAGLILLTLGKTRDYTNALSFISFNVAMVAGMLSLCWLNDAHNNVNHIGTDTTGYTLVRVTSPIVVKEKTTRLMVQALACVNNGKVSPATGNAYLYTYNSDHVSADQGDTLLLPGHWQPITNRGNPFEYDYVAYSARNNFFYRQFLYADDVQLYGRNTAVAGFIARCHNWCMQQLDSNIPDAEICGLMQAMLLGDEASLDDNLRQAWAQTGIMHYIAISGGNITIFFIIIAGLLAWLRHRKYLWVKYMVALPLVWLYVIIAGASPSAVRAGIMFTIVAMSLVLRQNNNNLNTLFAAAALLLIAQPMWLYTAGFQLSFIAILSLILFYGPVYSLYSPDRWFTRKLWQTIAGSIAVEILVAPLIIFYFYLFPLPFLISNLLGFLLMNAVLVLGITVIGFGWFPFLAKAAGWVIVWLTTAFNNIIFFLQRLNPTSFSYLYLTPVELICTYLIITSIALLVLRKQKAGLFAALINCCMLLFLLCTDQYTALHQQRFAAYNMGAVNQMEVTMGKRTLVANTDIHTLTTEKDHTLKAPHATWHSWQSAPVVDGSDIFIVNGRSVLLLTQPVSTGRFPVDYLVVNMPPGKVHPAILMQVFHPRTIVFGSNYTLTQTNTLLAECARLHISAWYTGTSGAFVWGI